MRQDKPAPFEKPVSEIVISDERSADTEQGKVGLIS